MKTNYETIQVGVEEGVALLTMNNPPVNQFSPRLAEDFYRAVSAAFEDPEIKALVLTGTGRNFIAGADINTFLEAHSRDEAYPHVLKAARFISSIETGPKPVVAAINGNCLGGGLEIAMACHFRVAAGGVRLGQPEVLLGIIPGAGGTQRLPRLVGLPHALEMITTGKPVTSETALERGLVDEVAARKDLPAAAKAVAARFVSGDLEIDPRRTRNRSEKLPDEEEKAAVLGFAKAIAADKARGYIAPFKALEAVEKGLSEDIDADIEREVGLCSDCIASDVARNLIALFFGNRSAGRLPRIETVDPLPVQKVGVLGGGVMGSGIVAQLLKTGFEATLWDIDEAAVDKGVRAVRKTFAYAVKKNKMSPEDLDRLIEGKLAATTSMEAMRDADLIIEAVVEDMEVKQKIWRRLERICLPAAVFATNTSALPISEMASALDDPGRMIGLHFFNPAERMQLVEIICTQRTSDRTLATSVAFAKALKKIPVVVQDGPGFYVSRQLGGLLGGAVFLLADGVDPAAVEAAMVDFGLPMGPAALSDLTGIDINYHVSKTFEERLGPRYTVHPLTERIYRTGCFGRKTGAGYFDYGGDSPVPNPKVATVINDYLAEKGVSRREAAPQEIVETMMALAVNEAALMMEEGICDRPQDMDLAMVYGTGFPPYRGGILRYADQWGINNIYAKLKALEKRYGQRFSPAGLMVKMAEGDKTFYTA